MGGRVGLGPVFLVAVVCAVVLSAIGVISVLVLDIVCLAAATFAAGKLLGAGEAGFGSATLLLVGAACAMLILRLTHPDLRFMPYLLIFPANLLACVVFARGLLPGREPVLLTLIKLMDRQPADSPEFIAFVRGQCALWSVVSLLTAVLALACIPFSVTVPGLATALGIVIVAQLIWFPLSHFYANWRHNRVETFWNTIAMMVRPEARALVALR